MPIYEYVCPACRTEAERLVAVANMKTPDLPCPKCQGPMQWAGLSAPAVGREQRFAAIMADGTRVPGHINRSAPLRPRTRS